MLSPAPFFHPLLIPTTSLYHPTILQHPHLHILLQASIYIITSPTAPLLLASIQHDHLTTHRHSLSPPATPPRRRHRTLHLPPASAFRATQRRAPAMESRCRRTARPQAPAQQERDRPAPARARRHQRTDPRRLRAYARLRGREELAGDGSQGGGGGAEDAEGLWGPAGAGSWKGEDGVEDWWWGREEVDCGRRDGEEDEIGCCCVRCGGW
ncbi:hypothetical protein BU26DRAFT_596334 [Trematosphaeria pertusa]|uniref:Uncharacterized protein n=1 Tax=Trematosphaeria pertusa TaxID=390896 RepID=A0A6A6ICV0_9PLEO|nr:uncharacterized protein BU26DRAFT_596334 [Trematosphaeria pertusa]KAF2248404.1 hypothetical protein BU26DRAFT_596334 [Trematosphaeria pertusa]